VSVRRARSARYIGWACPALNIYGAGLPSPKPAVLAGGAGGTPAKGLLAGSLPQIPSEAGR